MIYAFQALIGSLTHLFAIMLCIPISLFQALIGSLTQDLD